VLHRLLKMVSVIDVQCGCGTTNLLSIAGDEVDEEERAEETAMAEAEKKLEQSRTSRKKGRKPRESS